MIPIPGILASPALVGWLMAIPPTVAPDAVRVASDASAYDAAATVASLHGGILAFGVRGRDDGGINRGAVYLHALQAGSWTQVQKVTPNAPQDREEFGESVSLHGSTLVVGAPSSDRDGTDAGSAWIFGSNGVNFTQTQRITPPLPTPLSLFGCSVALDGAGGQRIAVGARRDQVDGTAAGSVHLFRFADGVWVHEARLTAPGVVTEGDDFGQAIALHGDLLAVGTPNEDVAGANAGAVHIFRRQGSAWNHEARLLSGTPEPLGEFGCAVSLDGTTLAIGAYREDGGAVDAGRIHLFTRGPTAWEPAGVVDSPTPSAGAEFGSAVALDGTVLAVGSPQAIVGAGTQGGTAFVFRKAGANWSALASLASTSPQAAEFTGASVALSNRVLAVGAPLRTQSSAYQGAALVVDLSADCDNDGTPDRVALAAGAADCNLNGIPDACDIAQGAADADLNGVPDTCEVVPCPADLNGSGTVNAVDLALLIATWSDEPGSTSADINGDGAINGADLGILLSAWGACP